MKRTAILTLSLLTMFSFLSAWRVNALSSGEKSEHIRSLRDFFMEFRRGRGVLPSDLSQLENRLRNFPRATGALGGIDSERATRSDSLNVRMVGRWPYGPSYAVAVDRERQLAFLGSGGAVLIFDLSDPWDPVKVGEITTPGVVSGLFYSDTILYVADGGAGFIMISVENPSLPVEIGYYDTPSYTWAVAAADSFAYVIDNAEYDWALRALSISDPGHIQEEGEFPSPSEFSFAYNVAVQDTLAFITVSWPENLLIVSIANPAAIYEVGSYSTASLDAFDVAISDTLAFVASADGGLVVLSIADPSDPVLKGTSPVPPFTYDFSVSISDSFAYTTGLGSFRIISISDPANPLELGRTDSLTWAWDVAHMGTYAYLADSWEGMWTISTIDPMQPVVHRSYEGESWSDDVAVTDTLVSVANAEKGLVVLSVSDPTRPRELGYYDLEGENWAEAVASREGFAYVTGFQFDFSVFSLLDPHNPVKLGSVPLEGQKICVSDDYAYLAAGGDFHVVSILDPDNPFDSGSCDIPGGVADIVVSHPYAYAAVGAGVSVIDISSPSNPQVIGNLSMPDYTSSVALYHSMAFATNLENGLYSLDVSDPANPLLVNHCDLDPYPAYDVDALRGLACVAAGGDGGLRIMNPSTCEILGYYNTPGQAGRVIVSDSLIYVADGEGGIIILEYYGPNSIEGPEGEDVPLAQTFLFQNYPNPFNPMTTISFTLSGTDESPQMVSLSIYDLRGGLVKSLIDEDLEPGRHSIVWDGRDGKGQQVSSGIYLYTLRVDKTSSTRKMVVLE